MLYTGIAKDVEAPTKGEALRAEYALKRLSPAEKLRWCLDRSEGERESH